jgi:transposase
VKEVFYKIRNEYRNWRKIVIILDNARYNHAKDVKILAEKLWIKLLFLPPYSPNLNLIERVWKFLKKVLKNQYTSTFTEFVEKINNTCWKFNTIFKENLSTLLNNKVQIIRD